MKRLLVALAVALAVPVAAVELSTLSAAAVQGPLLEVARTFQQQTGHVVRIQFDTVPSIGRRIAGGETADVLIATAAAVEQALKDGRVIENTRTALGRIGIGVAVTRGRARPSIGTTESLKAALLAADTVVISQGTSGAYVQKMFAGMGITEQLKGKVTEVTSGVAVMERLGTQGRNEIGLTMLSEIMNGEAHGGGTLVGPLPGTLQTRTSYEVAVMTASKQPDVARQFLDALRTPAARQLFVGNGWEVPGVAARPILNLEP